MRFLEDLHQPSDLLLRIERGSLALSTIAQVARQWRYLIGLE
jgi:hypothetical protein